MLVLSRKTKQQIVVGKGIVVTVLEITADRVKIGISAPESQHIVRSELAPPRSLQANNRRARPPTPRTG